MSFTRGNMKMRVAGAGIGFTVCATWSGTIEEDGMRSKDVGDIGRPYSESGGARPSYTNRNGLSRNLII